MRGGFWQLLSSFHPIKTCTYHYWLRIFAVLQVMDRNVTIVRHRITTNCWGLFISIVCGILWFCGYLTVVVSLLADMHVRCGTRRTRRCKGRQSVAKVVCVAQAHWRASSSATAATTPSPPPATASTAPSSSATTASTRTRGNASARSCTLLLYPRAIHSQQLVLFIFFSKRKM